MEIKIEIFDKWLISLDHVTYMYTVSRLYTYLPNKTIAFMHYILKNHTSEAIFQNSWKTLSLSYYSFFPQNPTKKHNIGTFCYCTSCCGLYIQINYNALSYTRHTILHTCSINLEQAQFLQIKALCFAFLKLNITTIRGTEYITYNDFWTGTKFTHQKLLKALPFGKVVQVYKLSHLYNVHNNI